MSEEARRPVARRASLLVKPKRMGANKVKEW
jgi:hypothetical protein